MKISQELESMAKDRPLDITEQDVAIVMAGFKSDGIQEPQHDNYRCRFCLFTDGYTEDEISCRHCGMPLYGTDSI